MGDGLIDRTVKEAMEFTKTNNLDDCLEELKRLENAEKNN